jgi:hypothetical protein
MVGLDVSGEPADRPDEERVRHPSRIMHGVRIISCNRRLAARREERPHALRRLARPMGRRHASSSTRPTTPIARAFRGPPATTRQDIFTSRDLHVTERFTRVDADSILYRFTVDDPATFVKPWSGEMVIRKMEGPLFEYACHEGNYGLANILSSARVEERTAGGQTAP